MLGKILGSIPAFLIVLLIANAGNAAESEKREPMHYPSASSLEASVYIGQFKTQFPDEEELRNADPRDITSKLIDKTIIVHTSSVKRTIEEGVTNHNYYNGQKQLVYLAADGSLKKFFGDNDVRSGVWTTAEDQLIVFIFKSRDVDGATRISFQLYPLVRFLRGIRDSKDGDYCQFKDGSTRAVVMSNGQIVSRRLAQACGRRR